MEHTPSSPTTLGISRNVFFMGIVSFFNDVASEMIFPILPIFLTSTLGAPIAIVGLIEGIAEASASIFKVLSGWLSDRIGARKSFVVIGYTLSALSKILFGFAHFWPTALVARTSDRFGKGIRTAPRDALIAESTNRATQGAAFGFHRGMDALGAFVGPLIVLALLPTFGSSLHKLFLLAAIPGALGIFMLIVFVREVQSPKKTTFTALTSWRSFGTPFFIFIAINTLFALGNSSDAFLILRSQAVGLSLTHIILLYTLFNATRFLFSLPAGIVSDRIGPRPVIIFGFFLFSLVYLAFGLVTTPTWLWLLLPLYGVYMALTDGVSKAYIATIVSHKYLGTAYGIYQVTTGIATFLASLMTGIVWESYGSALPFIIGSVIAGCATLALAVFDHYVRHHTTPDWVQIDMGKKW
jgi:MFS family permease